MRELKKTKGVFSRKRYNEISELLKTISETLMERVNERLDASELIENEIKKQREYLTAAGYENIGLPSEKMLRTAVQFKPFTDNANYTTYLNSIRDGFYNAWDNSVRIGFIAGEPTKKIITRVMGMVAKDGVPAAYGTMQTLRQSIERNTRTYLQSMAAEAREATFKENEDIFGGYKFVATLDRRTCIVCASYDGKVFSTLEDCPKVPLHYNCRCTIVPIIPGLSGFGSRSSDNGYVGAKTTYSEWLEEQPPDKQKFILGARRYEMYRNGARMDSFVDDGRKLTLKELEKI